jgi:hypothetical protein
MLFKPLATVSPVAFDPETIKLMGEAFDRAKARLGYTPPSVIREYVANRILGAANRGEWDVERLIAAALV